MWIGQYVYWGGESSSENAGNQGQIDAQTQTETNDAAKIKSPVSKFFATKQATWIQWSLELIHG